MKISTLFLMLLSGVSNIILAQSAPDFTASDNYGKTHHLYAHLEEKRYVLISFSVKDWGGCIVAAQQCAEAYNLYGKNEEALITFDLNAEIQTNQAATNYAQAEGLNLPIVCIEGGGLEIDELYDDFVDFFPTVLLINPEKEVRTIEYNQVMTVLKNEYDDIFNNWVSIKINSPAIVNTQSPLIITNIRNKKLTVTVFEPGNYALSLFSMNGRRVFHNPGLLLKQGTHELVMGNIGYAESVFIMHCQLFSRARIFNNISFHLK